MAPGDTLHEHLSYNTIPQQYTYQLHDKFDKTVENFNSNNPNGSHPQ